MIAEAEAFEGKYEILEKIREGGMGAVYKVRHRLLDEMRVIKVIRPQLSTSPEMGERFLREARLAIRVRHPNIAQLHDFSIDPDGTAYIVMELIDGLTLADVLARTAPLPLALALEIARGALSAVGYLHRRQLIHRDISPDNLMLGRDEEGGPRVTLLDLGIAKSLAGSSALTSTGAFLGKPRYASPEHFGAEGLEAVGPRSDLYSLGVVLYELMTGVCPVRGRDTSSWIAGHLFRPPLSFAESDPEGRVPADLQAILLKVLAKAPADRFASAEEMAAAIEPVRVRFPVEPGMLERALGALDPEAPPAAPPIPGTTQDALDRRFAPLQTPPPRPAPAPTLVLRTREEPPRQDVPRPSPAAEHTEVAPVPLPRQEQAAAPPPGRRRPYLIPLLAALGLLISVPALWWSLRARAPQPVNPKGTASAPPAHSPAPPEPSPPPGEPIEATPVAPAPEPGAEPPAPVTAQERERTQPPATEKERPRPVPTDRSSREPEKPAPVDSKAPEPQKPEPAAAPSGLAPDHPAELIEAPKPAYPQIARGTGLRAQIFVKIFVDQNGRVVTALVEKAFAQRGTGGKDPTREQALAFREAAVEAARRAVYRPAVQGGQPAGMWKQIVYDFQE